MKKNFVIALMVGMLGGIAYLGRRRWLARLFHLSRARYDVKVERALRVPMTDGMALIADHYFPTAQGSFPTILIRSPYGRDLRGGALGIIHMFVAQRFAERGYHVILQDTRGRYDSEGEFEPFIDEKRDGLATLDWIAHQSWFDGNLGMWGQSYDGYVQWAVAADAPDYFKAMVPSITGSQLTPFTYSSFALDTMLRWLDNLQMRPGGKQLREFIKRVTNPAAQTRAMQPAFNHLPISESDRLAVGQPVSFYRKWLEHAHIDAPFWKSLHHGQQMERVRASVHFISGWYDFLLYQLLTDYEAMRAAGHSPYLTIGPWRHLDVACMAETLRAGVAWFDANLKGIRRPLRQNPVRIFMMGADEWCEYESFPPSSRATRLYLHEHARLDTTMVDANSSADRYIYDPANPTPMLGGPLYHQEGGIKDNRVLEARHDTLTYTSAPLENDADVIGWVKLELFVNSSAPTTDFFGRLCDVHPDGRSLNVCDGLFRIDPQNPGEPQTDGSVRIVVDMWATAQRFLRGHRIRLIVASGAHPRFNRNLGTGEPIATATRMIIAEQTVYHDAAHPSALVLPIIGN